MKTCSKCRQSKPLSGFTRDNKRKDGLNVYCRECTRAQVKTYADAHPEAARLRGAKWYQENKTRRLERSKAWFASNPGKASEYCAKWRSKNLEGANEMSRQWYAKNREAALRADKQARENNLEKFLHRERASLAKRRARKAETSAQWRERHPHKVNFYAASRRSAIAKRTPPWLTDADFESMESQFLYAIILREATGVSHHVDHIVPLRGRNVSGLNVPWNLQVLPAIENLKKSNSHAT